MFGRIVAFTTLQSRIFFPLGQLLQVQVDIQGALALFDRIFEYLDIPVILKMSPMPLPLTLRGRVVRSPLKTSHLPINAMKQSSPMV